VTDPKYLIVIFPWSGRGACYSRRASLSRTRILSRIICQIFGNKIETVAVSKAVGSRLSRMSPALLTCRCRRGSLTAAALRFASHRSAGVSDPSYNDTTQRVGYSHPVPLIRVNLRDSLAKHSPRRRTRMRSWPWPRRRSGSGSNSRRYS
jgi:hypothetical protein